MSFLELLLASGLLLGSSAASMGIWNQVSLTLEQQRHDVENLASLEAEVQAAEARLRDPHQDPLGRNLSCAEQRRRLVARLENQPPRAGVVRTLDAGPGADLLLLRLRSGDQERQRVYSPAAFGGCGGEGIAQPPEPPGEVVGAGGGDGAV